MSASITRRALFGALSASSILLTGEALAQSWPSRTINAVVPFGPGTSIEAAARPIFEQMARALGQPIIIEHRPGAGGTTGAAAVARAAPDGHTLLVYSSSFAISHSIQKNRRYDTLADFIPVLPFGVQPNVIVTAPSGQPATIRMINSSGVRRMRFATACFPGYASGAKTSPRSPNAAHGDTP
jgi:tripartite-type tricarboxylate transporter receptor subunit TctC